VRDKGNWLIRGHKKAAVTRRVKDKFASLSF